MKPDNLLLAGRTWKLADFNLACDFDPKFYMTRRVGTRPYAAPEVKEKQYTEKCDVYSAGILFIALARGVNYEAGDNLEPHPLDQASWDKHLGCGAIDLVEHLRRKKNSLYEMRNYNHFNQGTLK